MIVISNSSPLLALSQVQRLDILKTLFGHIYIPDSVYRETVLECSFLIRDFPFSRNDKGPKNRVKKKWQKGLKFNTPPLAPLYQSGESP